MKIIRDLEIAKSTLLKRIPLELQEIPLSVKQRIKEAFGEELTPQQVVSLIVGEVHYKGDAALFDYTTRLDGVELTSLEVKREEIAQSYAEVGQELLAALELAAQRIQIFHRNCRHQSWVDFSEGGLGQWVSPLNKVGIYVPGGKASYPSTLLMTAIPAKVAGVREVVIVTPPGEAGRIPPATLAAADIAKVDRVFSVGGAPSIAALAFGTQSIPKVDKICGPGNIFVQLAKKEVYGIVDIDGLYGPTETIILADKTANPAVCAADLLAQAEHDPLASAILITTSSDLATEVNKEIEDQLIRLPRKEIITDSLQSKGGIILVTDMEQAIELVNDYAPEHLSLMLPDAWSYLEKMKNAGGIFVGESAAEVIGDYIAGPSHVMPTGGTARFGSPLGIETFLKFTNIIAIDNGTLKTIGPAAATIARAEGLEGHAQAADIRLPKLKDKECL